jgi:uncharacterized protein (DUF427 family)
LPLQGRLQLLLDHNLENAVWQYREPFAVVAKIKDRIAFYPDRVDLIEEQTGR